MARKAGNEELGMFHAYNIHIPTRTIYIGSVQNTDDGSEIGIDNVVTAQVIKNLHILDNTKEEAPIIVYLNTPGGDYYHGMFLYDAISQCKNHITILGGGYIMSMGAIIMQSADDRVMLPNSRMMIHYGTNGFGGHSKDFDSWSEENRRINLDMESILLERIRQKHPKYTRKKLADMIKYDKFLTANQALSLGLIDRIAEVN